MNGTALLAFDDVACRRGGRVLFEHLSFSLGRGDALLLRGPNGVGKSSLIRLAAGLLKPAGGKIERSGTAALLGHELALDDVQSLEAALNFWARLDGSGKAAVAGALQSMALEQLAPVPVRFLSSGQKRRAGLARVIASGVSVWLLDEPGVGLDAASLALLAAAVERHRAEGGTVIAATHMELGLRDTRSLDLEAAA